jgi:hypothetical protein
MKAWQLDRLGGTLSLNEVQTPEVRFSIYQNFLIDYLIKEPKSIGSRDRAIYAAAYRRNNHDGSTWGAFKSRSRS